MLSSKAKIVNPRFRPNVSSKYESFCVSFLMYLIVAESCVFQNNNKGNTFFKGGESARTLISFEVPPPNPTSPFWSLGSIPSLAFLLSLSLALLLPFALDLFLLTPCPAPHMPAHRQCVVLLAINPLLEVAMNLNENHKIHQNY